MRVFSLLLILSIINFSAFAFLPAESKSSVVISESVSASETKTTETAASKATVINSSELIEKLEANKSKMNFKERLATKLITKKLRKLEKQNAKKNKSIDATKEVKDSTPLGGILRFIGVLLIILGVIGLFVTTVTAGVGTIIVGVIFVLLPLLI